MESTASLEQAIDHLQKLPPKAQKEAINLIETRYAETQPPQAQLTAKDRMEILDSCFGVWTDEQAEQVMKFIEQDFEQIEWDEWNNPPRL